MVVSRHDPEITEYEDFGKAVRHAKSFHDAAVVWQNEVCIDGFNGSYNGPQWVWIIVAEERLPIIIPPYKILPWDEIGETLQDAYNSGKLSQSMLREMFKDWTGRKLWKMLEKGVLINDQNYKKFKFR